MLLAVGPVGGLLAGVGERSEGAVVCEFDDEGAVCWKLEKFTEFGRSGVAAAIVLEPPVFFGEVEEWVHGEVGIGAVGGGDAVAAVHAGGPRLLCGLWRVRRE
jgi:hypothetical protein